MAANCALIMPYDHHRHHRQHGGAYDEDTDDNGDNTSTFTTTTTRTTRRHSTNYSPARPPRNPLPLPHSVSSPPHLTHTPNHHHSVSHQNNNNHSADNNNNNNNHSADNNNYDKKNNENNDSDDGQDSRRLPRHCGKRTRGDDDSTYRNHHHHHHHQHHHQQTPPQPHHHHRRQNGNNNKTNNNNNNATGNRHDGIRHGHDDNDNHPNYHHQRHRSPSSSSPPSSSSSNSNSSASIRDTTRPQPTRNNESDDRHRFNHDQRNNEDQEGFEDRHHLQHNHERESEHDYYHQEHDHHDDHHHHHHQEQEHHHHDHQHRPNSRHRRRYHRHRQEDRYGRPPQPEEQNHSETSNDGRNDSVSSTGYYSDHKRYHPTFDDADGHYICKLGDSIGADNRFKILSFMGEGTFARVVECWDRHQRKYVAIKIVRAVEKYTESAEIEIDVLCDIKKHDPQGDHHCVELVSSFLFRNHMCLVFPKYGLSLYDFLKKNHFHPFLYRHVQSFARQILESIAFIHDLTLIHTDLKPENILLEDSSCRETTIPNTKTPYRIPKSTSIRVIDFGSATFDSHHHSSIISTRHYRAPEVILGLGWTYPADVWSVGCILVEMYTGNALFQTHENREHLAMMERTLGRIPKQMTARADEYSRKYFRRDHSLNWPLIASSRSSETFVATLKPLDELISDKAHHQFLSLLRRLLEYDPDDRITAREALKHPFFDIPLDNTAAAAAAGRPDDSLSAERGLSSAEIAYISRDYSRSRSR